MQFKDYYDILGVAKDADQDEIKRAYRKLARKYHPDVSKEADAEDRFKDVGEAYEALKDPERRKAYDQLRAGGYRPGQEFRPPPGWQAGGTGGGFSDDLGGFSDFFESIFGARRGAPGGFAGDPFSGGMGGARPGQGRRGHDLSARAVIDLHTAYAGGDTQLRMPDGRTLKVKIPAGVTEGQKIRLAGQGAPGQGAAPAGDLLLEVEFRPHPQFSAEGRNISATVNLAPWEAALGGTIQAPTPGGPVDLRIPAGSRSGQRMRLRERGLPGQPPGDLYLTVQIQTPPAEDDAARAFYEKMAQDFSFNPRS